MASSDRPIIVCTDGSDAALAAAVAGVGLLGPGRPLLVAVVTDEVDPMLLTGTGMAGGLPPDEYDRMIADAQTRAEEDGRAAATAVGVDAGAVRVLAGHPGEAICDLAVEVGAAAIVMGSRGRSGMRRAFMGSVSDHVVRHAPCTVVITGPEA